MYRAIVNILNYILCFAIGAAIGAGIIQQQEKEIIQQCEAELPRNQHCKLIAVPDGGGK